MSTKNQLAINFTAELIDLVKRYEDNTDSHLYCQVVRCIEDYGRGVYKTNDNLNYIRSYIKVTLPSE